MAAVPCNDAAFRAQDEELYVTKTAVSNASAAAARPRHCCSTSSGRGERSAATSPHTLRAPRTCSASPPPSRRPSTELDAAIAALEAKDDAGPHLTKALASLQSAQSALLARQ